MCFHYIASPWGSQCALQYDEYEISNDAYSSLKPGGQGNHYKVWLLVSINKMHIQFPKSRLFLFSKNHFKYIISTIEKANTVE